MPGVSGSQAPSAGSPGTDTASNAGHSTATDSAANGDSAAGDRQQAGADLQKAAAQLARAADQVGGLARGDAGGEAAQSTPAPSPGTGAQSDPLMAGTSQNSSAAGVFDASSAAAGTPGSTDHNAPSGGADVGNSSNGPASADTTGNSNGADGQPGSTGSDLAASGESLPGGPSADTGESGNDNDADEGANANLGDGTGVGIDARIEAARDALRKAGVEMHEAGAAVATASTGEEMKKAQAMLARARIDVIVASQDIQDARAGIGEPTAGQDKVLDDAQKNLDDATLALVVATQSVQGLPDLENLPTAAGVPEATSESDKVGKLDDQLNHSLVVFDGKLQRARNKAIEKTTGPVIAGGTTADVDNAGTDQGNGPAVITSLPGDTANEGAETGKVASESSGANSEGNAPMGKPTKGQQVALVPEGVGSGQDDDIVARQLREAAMAETDPALREKLWDEYKRYKAGLKK